MKILRQIYFKTILIFNFIFWRLKTILSSNKTKKNYIADIQRRALGLAHQRKLPYSFTLSTLNSKGRKRTLLGEINLRNLDKTMMTHRNIVIRIGLASSYLMAPKDVLLKTIFHEYGHFILHFIPINSNIQYRMHKLWLTIELRHFYNNNFEEDFCENFAHYVIEGDSYCNPEVTSLFQNSVIIVSNRLGDIFQRIGY